MNFFIDRAILEVAPRTRLAVLRVEDCEIGFGHGNLDETRLRVCTRLRKDIKTGHELVNVPQIAGVDQLMSHFDGQMRRPRTVTEDTLRKLLEGGPIPVENDAVDSAVLLSIYYRLPVFAADADKLVGDVGLVLGRESRDFEGHQGQARVRTEDRIFLTDDIGYFDCIVAAGKRAAVTERTQTVLLVAVFPENVGDSIVRDFLRRARNWFENLCGGEVTQEGMVGEPETG
ncbi:MAG: phenylalanine--tRNA ligase beta subunit-related protein [Planctomycetota bacterium]